MSFIEGMRRHCGIFSAKGVARDIIEEFIHNFIKEFQGDRLYIPQYSSLTRHKRDQLILEMHYKKGLSYSAVGKKVGLSSRRIREICNGVQLLFPED